MGNDLDLVPPIESLKDDGGSNALSAMLEYLDSPTGSEETDQLVEEDEVFRVLDEGQDGKGKGRDAGIHGGSPTPGKLPTDRLSPLTPLPSEADVAPSEEPEEKEKRFKLLKKLAKRIEKEGCWWKAMELGYASWVVKVVEEYYVTRMVVESRGEGRKRGREHKRLMAEGVEVFQEAVKLVRDWEVETVGFTRDDVPGEGVNMDSYFLSTDRGWIENDPAFVEPLVEFFVVWAGMMVWRAMEAKKPFGGVEAAMNITAEYKTKYFT